MKETEASPIVAKTNSSKMLRAMVGIGIICALMIVLTYEGTLSTIKANRSEALEKAIFKVLPGTAETQAFQFDEGTFRAVGSEASDEQLVYAGFDEQGQLTGLAIEAGGQGYADIIRILYGYDPEKQSVIGVHVLESKETPGLGDKIEKDPDFLANFEALDVSLNENLTAVENRVVPVKNGQKENPWEVDGITGATISSRAIGEILGESTAHWVPIIYQNQANFKIKKSNE